MSDNSLRLPHSLNSLIDYSLTYSKLAENLACLCEWSFTNENSLKNLKNMLSSESERTDGIMKKLPGMEDNLHVCLRGLDEVYRVKDKVNSWGERFLALEEKYYSMMTAIRDNQETIENKIKIQNDRFEKVMSEMQQKVTKQIREEIEEVERYGRIREKEVQEKFESIQEQQATALSGLDEKIRQDMNSQFEQVFTILNSQEIEEQESVSNIKVNEQSTDIQPILPQTVSNPLLEEVNSEPIPEPQSSPQLNPPVPVIEPANPPKPKTKKFHLPGSNSSISEGLIKDLSSRLSSLESKLQKILPSDLYDSHEIPTKDLNLHNPEQKDDFTHEFHLKYVILLKEFNHLKEFFSNLKPRDPATDKLAPERIPNFSQYIPYMTRIQTLEDLVKNLIRENAQNSILSEISQMNEKLKAKVDTQDIAEIMQKVQILERTKTVDTIQDEIEELKHAEEPSTKILPEIVNNVEPIKPSDSNESSIRELFDAVNKINRNLLFKVSRNELEEVMKNLQELKAKPLPQKAGGQSTKDNEKLTQLESTLISCINDSNYLKKCIETLQQQITDDILDQLKSLSYDCNLSAHTLRAELSKKLNELRDEIFHPGRKSEIQNIEVLRNLLFKVQKESAECKERIQEIQSTLDNLQESKLVDDGAISPEIFPEEPPEDQPSISPSPQLKQISVVLQKHEQNFKQLRSHLSKLAYDLEQSQLAFKKQNEINLSNSLRQLEELKSSVSDVMLKLREGNRLSQSDLNKITELYTLVENKGDKEDITNKVDKQELKKAYRFLTKRIESLHKELKKAEEMRLTSQSQDDPALFRKKQHEFECISCGQEIKEHKDSSSVKREWRPSNKFPGSTIKLGPGFSRVLPVISPSIQRDSSPKALLDILSPRNQDSETDGFNSSLPKVNRNRSTRNILTIR
jgi:hypothetical protein